MNGILLVNKQKGMTSHDVIAKIKRILQVKKIGHAGTLDPLATGLLVVMINEATKLSNYLMEDEKEYVAEVVIGESTDTEDSEGQVLDKAIVNSLEDVDTVLESLTGQLEQVPPMYSAIKHEGKKLYQLAREGKTIERASRIVEIVNIKRTSEIEYFDNKAKFTFSSKVSKGTYIRTLCVEIGNRLGYPAHMSNLNRVGSGVLSIKDSYTINDIAEGNYKLIPMLDSLKKFKIIDVSNGLRDRILNGVMINESEIDTKEEIVVFSSEDKLIGIYKKKESNYRAERVWN